MYTHKSTYMSNEDSFTFDSDTMLICYSGPSLKGAPIADAPGDGLPAAWSRSSVHAARESREVCSVGCPDMGLELLPLE